MPRLPKPWFRNDRNSWFVTIRGQRHNLGPDKKKAFDRFYELMKAESDPPEAKVVKDESLFVAVADEFLEWVKANRADRTYEWYQYRVQRFCQMYPDLVTTDLKPFHVQKWVDGYPDFSRTTKRNYIRAIKRCIAWAVSQGYLDKDPLTYLRAPSAARREVVLNQADFDLMISNLPDPQMRLLCTTAYQVGCRPQELLKLEARHIDLPNFRWIFPIEESKGKREPRIVYMTPEIKAHIEVLLAKYPHGKLFRNSQGKPWTVSAVNCSFKRLQHRMGSKEMKRQGIDLNTALLKEIEADESIRAKAIKDLTKGQRRKLINRARSRYAPKYCLYSLRHSFSTKALKSGVDALTVAVLLGHADVSTLSKVYQHVAHDPEYMRTQASKALGG